MLGQKIMVQKKLWSSKILITNKFYPKSFVKIRSVTAEIFLIWTNVTKTVLVQKKILCSKNLSETKFWAKKLRLSKNWAKTVWSKLGQ